MRLLFEVSGVVRALLVHRVYNIAKQGNWAPYLANKLFIGYRARLQTALRQRIIQLEARD